ncbi:MAG: TraB/GumN family protein [Betaproteobacteria bacterium]|nr:TraB/GumN family protein [Betaproteobacteria bacterium]
MNRRRALLALVACSLALPAVSVSAHSSSVRFDRGLLWRVARRGVAPSHVFGTIHLADPRVLDIPEQVTNALSRSHRYFMESRHGAPEKARLLEAAQFEDGRRLEPLIGAEAFGKLAAHLRGKLVPQAVIERMKPWAALANLTVTPEDYEGETPDQKLLALARSLKLAIDALEGIEEQIAVFEGIPAHTQVALLRHALEHRDDLVGLIEPTIQAWLKRDLAAIGAINAHIVARYPEMADHYRLLHLHVVRNRSIVMAHRLHLPLRRGGAFVAVGANHLHGEDGVLRLIEKQGYRVGRAY